MATLQHLTNKIMAERARHPQSQSQDQTQERATHTSPPPPYTTSDTDSSDTDSDSDSDPDSEPMNLTINASHTIHGSNNLVPTSPSALADATKFGTILLNAVTQLNNAAAAQNASNAPGQPRPLRVNLNIFCGVTVVGDRNVIGNVGLKPKVPGAAMAAREGQPVPAIADAVVGAKNGVEEGSGGSVVGAKRKADDDVSF